MAERYKPHQFRPDKQPETRGRKKGIPNRMTAMVKACYEGSAANIGRLLPLYGAYLGTGKKRKWVVSEKPIGPMIGHKATGEGGMQAYLESMGVLYPVAYLNGLIRLIPHQINAQVKHDHDHTLTVTERFKDVDLDKLPVSELHAMLREAISLTQPLPEPPKLITGLVIEHEVDEEAVA